MPKIRKKQTRKRNKNRNKKNRKKRTRKYQHGSGNSPSRQTSEFRQTFKEIAEKEEGFDIRNIEDIQNFLDLLPSDSDGTVANISIKYRDEVSSHLQEREIRCLDPPFDRCHPILVELNQLFTNTLLNEPDGLNWTRTMGRSYLEESVPEFQRLITQRINLLDALLISPEAIDDSQSNALVRAAGLLIGGERGNIYTNVIDGIEDTEQRMVRIENEIVQARQELDDESKSTGRLAQQTIDLKTTTLARLRPLLRQQKDVRNQHIQHILLILNINNVSGAILKREEFDTGSQEEQIGGDFWSYTEEVGRQRMTTRMSVRNILNLQRQFRRYQLYALSLPREERRRIQISFKVYKEQEERSQQEQEQGPEQKQTSQPVSARTLQRDADGLLLPPQSQASLPRPPGPAIPVAPNYVPGEESDDEIPELTENFDGSPRSSFDDEEEVDPEIQAEYESIMGNVRNDAARTIQQARRQQLEQRQRQRQSDAAIKIQAAQRGRVARGTVAARVAEIEQKERERAAIKIQAAQRGQTARRRQQNCRVYTDGRTGAPYVATGEGKTAWHSDADPTLCGPEHHCIVEEDPDGRGSYVVTEGRDEERYWVGRDGEPIGVKCTTLHSDGRGFGIGMEEQLQENAAEVEQEGLTLTNWYAFQLAF